MEKEMLSLRTAVFLAADALLAELQRGASVTEINVGDKVSLRQDDNSVSLLVGDVEVVTTGEIENYVLFHHKAHRAMRFEVGQIFEKIVKGGEFGESYIYDIPNCLKYNFPELDERTRESYVRLSQSFAWMLRTSVPEWTV
jgi:hypothetical protein